MWKYFYLGYKIQLENKITSFNFEISSVLNACGKQSVKSLLKELLTN